MNVGNAADVSEADSDFIFGVKVRSVCDLLCMFKFMFRETTEGGG